MTKNNNESDDQEMNCTTRFCRNLIRERIKLVLGTIFVFLLILVVFMTVYCVLRVFPLINYIIMLTCLTVLATVEVRCHSLVNTLTVKKFLVGIPNDLLVLLETGLPGVALTLTDSPEWIGICNFSWLLYGTAARLFCAKIRRIQRTIDSEKASNVEPMNPTEANSGSDFGTNEELTLSDYFKYARHRRDHLPHQHPGVHTLYTPDRVLFFQEGLIIVIVDTQSWDLDQRPLQRLQPDSLLVTEFSLRFMNMRDSLSVSRISMFFDAIGVGHCTWAAHMEEGHVATDSKQSIVRVRSAEILAITGAFVNHTV
eukprot:gene30415-37625_t